MIIRFTLCILVLFPILGQAQFPISANARDEKGNRVGHWTILYDSAFHEVTRADSAWYYRLIKFENGKPTGKVRDFFRSGRRQWEGYLLSINPDFVHGEVRFFYENNQVKTEATYSQNRMNGPYREFSTKGVLKTAGIMRDDSATGKWTSYFDSGGKWIEQEVNGYLQNGRYSEYFEDGKVSNTGFKSAGKDEGQWEVFYEGSGKLAKRLFYKDGVLNGPYEWITETGIVREKGDFKEGVESGPWTYYYENGILKSAGSYREGKKNGKWRFYYPSGNLESEGEIVGGLYQGAWTYYHENNTISVKAFFKDDHSFGEWSYYFDDGKLKKKGNFYDDESLEGFWEYYYANGNKEAEGIFVKNKKQGKWNFFYENSISSGYEHYEAGALHGEAIDYFSDGAISYRKTYKNGILDGRSTYYYANGNKKSDGVYADGRRIGSWQWFYENGKIDTDTKYKDGRYTWIDYYINGNVKSEGSGMGDGGDGKIDGYTRNYYANGVLKNEGIKRLGDREGQWTYYDSITGLKESEGNFRKDKADGKYVWYKGGKTSEEGYFINGWQETVANLSDSIMVLIEMGKYDLAEEHIKWQERVIKRDHSKEEYLDRFDPILRRAKIEYAKYNYSNALKGFVKYTEKVKKTFGPTTPQYLFVQNDIANCYLGMGKWQEAIELYDNRLKVYEAGQDNYLNVLSNKAVVLRKMGKQEESRKLLSDEYEKSLLREGDTSNYTIRTKIELAGHCESYPDLQIEAIKLFSEIYQSLLEQKKVEKSFFKQSMNSIAGGYHIMGDATNASKWYKRVLSYLEKRNGQATYDYLNVLHNFTNSYITLERIDTLHRVFEAWDSILVKMNVKNSFQEAKLLHSKASVLYSEYKNAEAIELWENAKAIVEKLGNQQDALYSQIVGGLGWIYKAIGKNELAEGCFIQQAGLTKKQNGENHKQYRQSLQGLANFYTVTSNYKMADSVFRVLEMNISSYLGKETRTYADYLHNHGNMKLDLSDYKSAEQDLKQSLAFYKGDESQSTLEQINILNDLSKNYRNWGKYDVADAAITRAIELQSKFFGDGSLAFADLKTTKGYLLLEQNLYKEAEEIFKVNVNQVSKLVGQDNMRYAYEVRDFADCYRTQGDYHKALPLYQQFAELAHKLAGKWSYEYLNASFRLAECYYNLDDPRKAEVNHKLSIEIARNLYGSDHPRYAARLLNYGIFCQREGRLTEAEKFFLESSKIVAGAFGEDHVTYSDHLESLSEVYFAMGRYDEVDKLMGKMILIAEHNRVNSPDEYVATQRYIGRFYGQMGRFGEAEVAYSNVLEYYRQQGKDYGYAVTAIDLAGIRYGSQQLEAAKSLLTEVLKIMEDQASQSNYYTLEAHNLLGLIAREQRNNSEAVNHFKYNLEQRTISGQDKTYPHAVVLHNMATVYHQMGEYAEADKLFTKSELLRRDLKIKFNPEDESNFVDNRALLYQDWNKHELAEKNWQFVTTTTLSSVQRNFAFMSDFEKAKFWERNKKNFEYYTTFAVSHSKQSPAMLGNLYNNQLATKAILLAASNKIRKRIYASRDSTLINHYHQWAEQREALARELSKSGTGKSIIIDSLSKVINTSEKELSISADEKQDDGKTITWKDVQRSLAQDEAAVEIIRYRYFKNYLTDSVVYAALVLTTETKAGPRLVTLANGKFLEKQAYRFYRNSIIAQQTDSISYGNFWKGVESVLGGKRKIYISPDGVFNQINLKTLRGPDNRFLMEAKDFIIVSNTKDVITIKDRKKTKVMQNASLLGDPLFFLSPDRVRRKSKQITRDVDNLDEEDRSGIAELPGTKVEVENIGSALRSGNWNVNSLTQDEATETALKNLSSSRLLHIATHGFFIDDKEASGSMKSLTQGWASQEPMMKSGLLLSGSANYLQNKIEVSGENGILTSYEAANLSLEGTELVVLSACETARGEIQNGEGVYGLQRAFQTAGAQSIIMSLWKVDDEATQQLMTSFYQYWTKGNSKNEALKLAQLSLKAKYPHPYFWGAFVMMGE